jgi:acyl carrier protein
MTPFDSLREMLIREGYASNPRPHTLLVSLEIDSMEKAHLLLEIEEALGFEIPDDDFHAFRTLQDICDYRAVKGIKA